MAVNGSKWQFEYSGRSIQQQFASGQNILNGYGYGSSYIGKVVLPTGGEIEYEYDPSYGYDGQSYSPWFYATDRQFPRLQQRTTSGADIQSGSWSYVRTKSNHIETTTVTSPSRIDVYRFHEGIDSWNFTAAKAEQFGGDYPWPESDEAFMGKLKSHEIRTLGNELVRRIDFVYENVNQIGSPYYRCTLPYTVCSDATGGWLDFGDNTLWLSQTAIVPVATVTTTDYLQPGTAYVYTKSTPVNSFDEFGFPLEVTETGWDGNGDIPISRTTTFSYDHNATAWVIGNVDKQITDGKTIDFDYFQSGIDSGLLQKENRYGVIKQYTYLQTGVNQLGELKKISWIKDGILHEERFSGYKRGIPEWNTKAGVTSDTADDISIKRGRDDLGRETLFRDGELNSTIYRHDELGRITEIDPPTQATTFIEYEISATSGFWDQTVLTAGSYQRIENLDGFGRVRHLREIDAVALEEIAVTYNYDDLGRLQSQTAPYEWTGSSAYLSAPTTTYEYDELDRVTKLTHVNGIDSVNTCYFQSCNSGDYGNFDSSLVNGFVQTDERGYETGYEFRALGNPDSRELTRIVQQAEISPNEFVVTRIARDAFGNIAEVKQGDGTSTDATRTYEYNSKLQLWRVTTPETGVAEFTYDEIGNRKTAKVNGSAITTFFYDGHNRLKSIVYPDPTPLNANDEKPAPDVFFGYYKNDLLDTIGHSALNWDYDYTKEGLVTLEVLRVNDSLDYFLENSYNSLGHLKSIVYPAGNEIVFSPDSFGRAREVRDVSASMAHVASVEYWPDDRVKTMTFANGVDYVSTRTDRLLPDTLVTAIGGAGIVSLDYGYDASANVVSIDDAVVAGGVVSNVNRSMGYDGIGRLTSANGFWGSGSIEYDRLGNISSKNLGGNVRNYNYDPYFNSNLLANIKDGAGATQSQFAYDSRGNISADLVTGLGYIFNDASQLIEVTGLGYERKFRYDGHGRRAVVERDSSTTFSGYNQQGKLMFNIQCTINQAEQFYYLGDMLVAREKLPCVNQGCHPSQQ